LTFCGLIFGLIAGLALGAPWTGILPTNNCDNNHYQYSIHNGPNVIQVSRM
jgi:hypothetical protein